MSSQPKSVNPPITLKQKKIMKLILDTGNITEVAKLLKVNKSYISRTVRVLRDKGYLKVNILPNNFREYLATSKGSQHIAEDVNPKPFSKIRIHRLEIKCTIPYASQPRWETYLNKHFSIADYKEVKLNNNSQWIMNVDNVRVKTTTKSILFYPDDIYADSVDDANRKIGEMIERIVPKIERRLSLKIKDIEVSVQEWAFQDDITAKRIIEDGNRLCILVNGQRRIIVDYSHAIAEFEAVHRKHAPEDAKKIEKLYSDIITDKFDHRAVSNDVNEMKNEREQFKSVLDQVQQQNALISENLVAFSKYLNQHIRLMAMAEQKYDLTEKENEKMKKALEKKANQSSIYHYTL